MLLLGFMLYNLSIAGSLFLYFSCMIKLMDRIDSRPHVAIHVHSQPVSC